ncbi:MAG: hypothetical protein J0L82_14375 [Deltaproteobacteria bacterium]|nr:hypothetical protein [Deltaproteobacteria bacterium]
MWNFFAAVSIFVTLVGSVSMASPNDPDFYPKVTDGLRTLTIISSFKDYSTSLEYMLGKVRSGSRYPCPGPFMVAPQDYGFEMKNQVNSLPPLTKAIIIACGEMKIERDSVPADIERKITEAKEELAQEIERNAELFNKIGSL